ncbi:RNA 2',3'-cyclic phosphodiesterase [Planomonospora venezuelensis]|uniref:RNA 2',3'-cyclic phosphodiesterase n=1 Tax=Planomonospora venezuelensis TaxID=1999 RepID=A0A841DAF2_PLAVE|nr:RNA 2',3'-cyclic phosphodiesterase [Planomonospora venezuelensis]MBB5965288.1 2'-5' RNA ligase [Planomonospora venezuelensis]GIN00478.1 RNA 2',3'-cyclic phosphodiesterase [Planomonospora venezuelensis]
MRLFAALLPPQRARDELARALEPHRAAWPRLRWADPGNWHLTLAFLGEVAEEVLPELEVRLARAASRHAPMTLAFTGAGAFPSARRARVLWAGLRDCADPPGETGPHSEPGRWGGRPRDGADPRRGRPRIVRLAESVRAGARRAGAVQVDESKRFRPHLTLARSRFDADVSPLVGALGPFAGTPWEAGAVHLVRSRLGAEIRYETVAEWPLAARAPGGRG